VSVKLEPVDYLIQHIKRADPRLYEALLRFSKILKRFAIEIGHLSKETTEEITSPTGDEVVGVPNVQNFRADSPTLKKIYTSRSGSSSGRIGRVGRSR
jgi:hypothetical protein